VCRNTGETGQADDRETVGDGFNHGESEDHDLAGYEYDAAANTEKPGEYAGESA
jgi:hypothetical protein